jgi:hypothetical protein
MILKKYKTKDLINELVKRGAYLDFDVEVSHGKINEILRTYKNVLILNEEDYEKRC